MFYPVCKQVALAAVELLISHSCLLNAEAYLHSLTYILAQRLACKIRFMCYQLVIQPVGEAPAFLPEHLLDCTFIQSCLLRNNSARIESRLLWLMEWTFEDERQDPYSDCSQAVKRTQLCWIVVTIRKQPSVFLEDQRMPIGITELKDTEPQPGTEADPRVVEDEWQYQQTDKLGLSNIKE